VNHHVAKWLGKFAASRAVRGCRSVSKLFRCLRSLTLEFRMLIVEVEHGEVFPLF
jgi:hypothetical protein